MQRLAEHYRVREGIHLIAVAVAAKSIALTFVGQPHVAFITRRHENADYRCAVARAVDEVDVPRHPVRAFQDVGPVSAIIPDRERTGQP